jgi:aquaporin related protein
MLEYETANPGQDFNEHEADAFSFDEENAPTGAHVARPPPIPMDSMPIGVGRSLSNQVSNSDGPKPLVGVHRDGDAVQEANKVVSGGMEAMTPAAPLHEGNEPVRPSNPNMKPIRMDGAISEKDEESLKGDSSNSFKSGPDAESGMMHPGFGGREKQA